MGGARGLEFLEPPEAAVEHLAGRHDVARLGLGDEGVDDLPDVLVADSRDEGRPQPPDSPGEGIARPAGVAGPEPPPGRPRGLRRRRRPFRARGSAVTPVW